VAEVEFISQVQYDKTMLNIGTLQFEIPVIQAALSGYSDLAMRRVARLHGAEFTFDELVLDHVLINSKAKRQKIRQLATDDRPVGGQLLGSEPDTFAEAANHLINAGYDCVDVNFGCPVRKVLGRGRGGYHLSQPAIALDIVRAVYDAVDGRRPIMVKMRQGWDHTPESRRNFFTILDGAFSIGVNAVTVHPRTVQQGYRGYSDWSFLAEVKQHVGEEQTILGSGDLFAAEDVVRMMDRTGVDGVTLARGCIGNPWLFRECTALLQGRPLPPPPAVHEQAETLYKHYQWLTEIYGDKKAGRLMRKFGIKYSELHPTPLPVRDAFIAARRPAHVREILEGYYDPGVDWPPVKRKIGCGDLIAAGANMPDDERAEKRSA
jgi:nifR3 family TIM-barrel protein